MRKINTVIILVGFWTAICLLAGAKARADQETGDVATAPVNQVLNDEGYGNADAEYYNSEDDVVNDDEPVVNQSHSTF